MDTYNKPELQEFFIDGVQHVAPYEAFTMMLSGEATLVDVREPSEVKIEKVGDSDNILYYPMSEILTYVDQIPTDLPVIVICTHGLRSTKVANLLMIKGFNEVANLDGGIEAWKAKGMPMAKGGHATEGESCGSGGCGGCSCGC